MNRLHRWICRSSIWRTHLRRHVIPWALDGVMLGDAVLEIGPGPGMATGPLLRVVPRLTALELDSALAANLHTRSTDAALQVVCGDGTTMPFLSAAFSGVVCFTMLHHVPSPEAQDRLFREVRRVLRPGGCFAGTDSRHSLGLALVHQRDTYVPVDPALLPDRLHRAGFACAQVDMQPRLFRFRAR